MVAADLLGNGNLDLVVANSVDGTVEVFLGNGDGTFQSPEIYALGATPASLAVATPCFAQQIRVLAGGMEHVYGRGGEMLDDADLQARNQRAWEQRQAEIQVLIQRQEAALDIKRFRLEEAMVAHGIGYWPR